MTMPLDPANSLDYSSAEQNVQLQPSSYQPTQTEPTPTTPSTSSTASTSTASHSGSSSSSSTSGSTDSVQISYDAQVKQLNSQGMSASNIAQTMGTTVAAVDTLLNITSTTTTTSSASTTTATTPTVML
jgi:hypothetical protein